VYTSGDEVELFLNGKSLGRQAKRDAYRLRWDDVVYEPGELKAVAYKGGRPWAEETVKTAGAGAQLQLQADRASIRADGSDLSFVTVKIADAEGRLVPRAKNPVTFEVSGPAEIAATDNGDPTDFTAFASPRRKAFNGLALVIVRSKQGEPGTITLRASAEGLAPAETTIQSAPATP
jgi:beta-galactosidase